MEVVLCLRVAELAACIVELEERVVLLGEMESDGAFAGEGRVIVIETLELRHGETSSLGEVGDSMAETSVEIIGVWGIWAKRSDLADECLGEIDGVWNALRRNDGIRDGLRDNAVGRRRERRSRERVDGGLDEVEKLLAKEHVEELHRGGGRESRVR